MEEQKNSLESIESPLENQEEEIKEIVDNGLESRSENPDDINALAKDSDNLHGINEVEQVEEKKSIEKRQKSI